MYDVWNPFDPSPEGTPEERLCLEQRMAEIRDALHFALLDLIPVIDDPDRDEEQVYRALRPFYDASHDARADVNDLPLVEALCLRVLEKGGTGQSDLQRELLRLVGERG